jgi:hypothetical protein
MLPTAAVFRWSFRWLPLVHVVLALCAAESLQLLGARWRLVRGWIPAFTTFALLLATYLWIPPNCGVPKYNLSQELNQAAPLDPERLYLSIYPAPESAFRIEQHPRAFGATVRPGSTSMFAGVRFVNGYSPIRPAGVAREFAAAIHGEIHPDVADLALYSQSGADGLLALLGVDGIIIATDVPTNPYPESEWQLAATTDEGRVFHRHDGPLPRVRSITTLDSRPNEQFVEAEVSGIVDKRNRLEAMVNVPSGTRPALLSISRPFFNGYRATIEGRSFPISSYRGLIPLIELPPGTTGRLEMVYRPQWLILGIAIAAVSAVVLLVSAIFALGQGESA